MFFPFVPELMVHYLPFSMLLLVKNSPFDHARKMESFCFSAGSRVTHVFRIYQCAVWGV